MKHFLISGLLTSGVIGLLICISTALAKPLEPVSALTLTAQDEQALKSALSLDTKNLNTMVWQGNPLTIVLPLNQEKHLIFPEPVQVNVNGQLTTKELRIINNDHSLYLTALSPFTQTTRIYVTLKNSSRIIFLDLMTIDHVVKKDLLTIQITPADHLQSSIPTQSNTMTPETRQRREEYLMNEMTSFSPTEMPGFPEIFSDVQADDLVQAFRFAWRQLYPPAYLLSNETDFVRTPMQTSFWISGLFYSDSVFAHPLASWTRETLTITAIELRNPYLNQQFLDLAHNLCGRWRAAMLFPRKVLQPAGHKPGDSTTLFLISSEPFERALGGCTHGRA